MLYWHALRPGITVRSMRMYFNLHHQVAFSMPLWRVGGLWLAWRRHLFKCLLSGPFQSIIWQFTSTEVYNLWLRLLGGKIGRQCWLSEQFKCTEFELFECRDTASMCRWACG